MTSPTQTHIWMLGFGWDRISKGGDYQNKEPLELILLNRAPIPKIRVLAQNSHHVVASYMTHHGVVQMHFPYQRMPCRGLPCESTQPSIPEYAKIITRISEPCA